MIKVHLYLKISPVFFQKILKLCSKNYASPATTLWTIISQFFGFNTQIKIDKKSIYITKISNKNLHFVGQLFELHEMIKSSDKIKRGSDLSDHLNFAGSN